MASYSKRQVYAITNKIYKFLREEDDHIVVQKLKGNVEGLYDPSTGMISLDPRCQIVPTLVHELIHHWHDDWSETKVLKEESKIIRSLSTTQMRNILKMLIDII